MRRRTGRRIRSLQCFPCYFFGFQFLFDFWFVLFLGSLVFVVCGLLFLFSSVVVCCRIPIHRVQVSDPFYENYYLLNSSWECPQHACVCRWMVLRIETHNQCSFLMFMQGAMLLCSAPWKIILLCFTVVGPTFDAQAAISKGPTLLMPNHFIQWHLQMNEWHDSVYFNLVLPIQGWAPLFSTCVDHSFFYKSFGWGENMERIHSSKICTADSFLYNDMFMTKHFLHDCHAV